MFLGYILVQFNLYLVRSLFFQLIYPRAASIKVRVGSNKLALSYSAPKLQKWSSSVAKKGLQFMNTTFCCFPVTNCSSYKNFFLSFTPTELPKRIGTGKVSA